MFNKDQGEFNKEMEKYLERKRKEESEVVEKPKVKKEKKEEKTAQPEEVEIIEEKGRGFFSRFGSIFSKKSKNEEDEEPEEEEFEEEFEEEDNKKRGFFSRWFVKQEEDEEVEEDESEYIEIIDKLSDDLKEVFSITNTIITSLPKRYIDKIKSSKEFEEYKEIIERFNSFKKGWNEMKKEN
ncbi:MAG: hypothetical protein PWQ28_79 [Candidatus Woesearchaeota archaeon]|nr:hypothetical protein [Candidatus Woesearchaeota archaeon]